MKLSEFIDWCCVVFIGLAVLLLNSSCGGGKNDQPSVYTETSPKGVAVRSSSRIPTDVLPVIDAQIDDLFRVADAIGYSGYSGHRSYRIEIVPRSGLCDAISFLITQNVAPGTNYDGSEYDRDPRPGIVSLCAAGQFEQSSGEIRVTAEGIRTSPIVRYEGEHKLLYQVDRARYEATKIHGQGQGHPILGDPSEIPDELF